MRQCYRWLAALVAVLLFGWPAAAVADAVVTDGRFTIIYVYPDPWQETWEQHIAAQGLDPEAYSRARIDKFVDTLMSGGSPSYFDKLNQYSGIHPPQFFGSSVVAQNCIVAAIGDEHDKVMQWDTIRSLANCHEPGFDPPPQVILVFSPDIKIAKIPNPPVGTGGDMCGTGTTAWHAWGLNGPNFIALPTDPKCAKDFAALTTHLSHEIVETLSDPGGFGQGGVPTDPTDIGKNEIGDKCEADGDTVTWSGYTVTQYWSNADNACVPLADDSPRASAEHSLLDASDAPLVRFTGDVHDKRVDLVHGIQTNHVTSLRLIVSTGGDNLNGGGGSGDNADATLYLASGGTISLPDLNQGGSWDSWSIHSVDVPLPAGGMDDINIVGVNLHTGFGGGLSGDNWNVERVQLAALGSFHDKVGSGTPAFCATVVVVSLLIDGLADTAPVDPQYASLVSDYAKVKFSGAYSIDPSGQSRQFTQTVGVCSGAVPVQIELWRNVNWKYIRIGPDANGKVFNERVPPNLTAGQLRTISLSYDFNSHQFTGPDGLKGTAGVQATVAPGAGADAPGVSFTFNDDRTKSASGGAAPSAPPSPPAPVPPPPTFGVGSALVLYGLDGSGALSWYSHDDQGRWSGPTIVATGWQGLTAFMPAGGPDVFAIDRSGALSTRTLAASSSAVSAPVRIASGWGDYKIVFGGGDGVIYAIDRSGALIWFRRDASGALGRPITVGSGWGDFTHVFSAGQGVIYGVKPDGTLLWYRHQDYLTGTSTQMIAAGRTMIPGPQAPHWQGPLTVGSGWDQFPTILAGGGGVVLAVRQDGVLVWYKHDDYLQGQSAGTGVQSLRRQPVAHWEGPQAIGTGWDKFPLISSQLVNTTGNAPR